MSDDALFDAFTRRNMTKCAGCRVRHLDCDTHSTCTECEKSGRECVRLNVRFRHLVCPSEKITRANYSKYEFFFDREQTWIETSGKIEFVAESDSSADASPTDEPENPFFNAAGLNAESRPALVKQTSSTFVLRSTAHTPTVQASILNDDQPDYTAVLEQVPHNPPGDTIVEDASKRPAYSFKKTSHPREKLPFDTHVSSLEKVIALPELAWPLKSLQEGKLFQHFVTHLAPWVCKNVLVMCALTDSD